MESSSDDETMGAALLRSRRKRTRSRTGSNLEDEEDTPRAVRRKSFVELKEKIRGRKERMASKVEDDEDEEGDKENENGSSDVEEDAQEEVSPKKKPAKLVFSDEEDEDDNVTSIEDVFDDDDGGDGDGEDENLDEYESETEDGSADGNNEDEQRGDRSGSASSEEDDEREDGGRRDDEFRKEFSQVLAGLSRSSEKTRKLTAEYHNSLMYEPQLGSRKKARTPKKKTKSSKKKLTYSSDDELDSDLEKGKTADVLRAKIYEPLMRELRPLGSRKGLSDVEIIREFVLYEMVVDDDCGGSCICGKDGLKYNFFIWNKNIEDVQDRTLYYKVCVGSECINHFTVAGSAVAFFQQVLCKGTIAHFRGKKKTSGALVFTLGGKGAALLDHCWDNLCRDYDVPIVKKRESNRLEAVKGKRLNTGGPLARDAKYRIFLNSYATAEPKFGERTPVQFRLVKVKEPDVVDPASKAAAAKEVTPKSFIKF